MRWHRFTLNIEQTPSRAPLWNLEGVRSARIEVFDPYTEFKYSLYSICERGTPYSLSFAIK